MTFVQAYGDQLDRVLGSADRTVLFTTQRRKDAINEAQKWFVTQTECVTKTDTIALVDGTQEYELEAGLDDGDLLWLSKDGPRIAADPGSGGTIVYYAGRDFRRTSIAWLDRFEAGWRGQTAGQPYAWYERADGGSVFFGVVPAPDIPVGATWTLTIPYVVQPDTLSADADVPFSINANTLVRLVPWHDVLPLYAGYELEKLRKGLERSAILKSQAEARVVDYLDKRRVPGGKTVGVARSYRRDARRSRFYDDYDNPWGDPWK